MKLGLIFQVNNIGTITLETHSMLMDQKKNIVKISILPKTIYTFNAMSIKISIAFFTELEQKILKFIQNHKMPRMAKAILKKKNKTEGITIPDFKLCYKVMVLKQYGTSIKTDTQDQQNRMENPEINPKLYGQLFFSKGGMNIQKEKDTLFNKWYWEN